MKKTNCMWSHCCGETDMCCCHCNKKTCIWRCTDDPKTCIYVQDSKKTVAEPIIEETSAKVRLHNELVSQDVKKKLLKYKKENKLHTDALAKSIGVNQSVLSKVLSADNITRIRSDSYNAIKDFVRQIHSTEKRKLW